MSERLSVIILAGGKGTRIKSVLGDIPKILAPIRDRVFLNYFLDWIKKSLNNVDYEIIIASGFGHNHIQKYCLENNLPIKLIREEKQLGTLGAAANAAIYATYESILILNGDTIFNCNFKIIFDEFLKLGLTLSVVLKSKENDRYGGYNIDEKGYLKLTKSNSSYISMGATFSKKILLIDTYKKFKSENGPFAMMDNDFISKVLTYPFILKNNNSFIDIGTLKSYKESQEIVPLLTL